MSRNRSGLTVVELVVIITMIAILIGLMLPSIQRVRTTDGRHLIANNLKQMGLAVHDYHDVHKQFPPATGADVNVPGANFSLSIHLLPFLEQNPLHQQYLAGKTVMLAPIPPFEACLDFSTSDFLGVQNYAGNVRIFTDVGVKTPFNFPVAGLNAKNGTCSTTLGVTFTDGTSNTIMFATRYANNGAMSGNGVVNCSAYASPVGANNSAFFGVAPMSGRASATSSGGWQLAPNLTQANCQFGVVAHAHGAAGLSVSMADGSCRRVSPSITPATWNVLMQPNDGNKPGADWPE